MCHEHVGALSPLQCDSSPNGVGGVITVNCPLKLDELPNARKPPINEHGDIGNRTALTRKHPSARIWRPPVSGIRKPIPLDCIDVTPSVHSGRLPPLTGGYFLSVVFVIGFVNSITRLALCLFTKFSHFRQNPRHLYTL